MDTSFGTSKFAISTFFDLNNNAAITPSQGLEDTVGKDETKNETFFTFNCANLTVFRVEDLHSR